MVNTVELVNLFWIYKGITVYIPFKLAGNVLSSWQLDIRLILNIHNFISFSISTTNAINSLNNNKAPFLCSGLQRPFQSHQHQSNHRQQGVMALLLAERCFSRSRDTRPSSDVFEFVCRAPVWRRDCPLLQPRQPPRRWTIMPAVALHVRIGRALRLHCCDHPRAKSTSGHFQKSLSGKSPHFGAFWKVPKRQIKFSLRGVFKSP